MNNVNHPKHYNQGSIEVIDYIKDSLTEEEYLGFIKGNVIKYIARAKHKNGIEDLEKAHWYLSHYISDVSSVDVEEEDVTVSSLSVIEIELLKRLMHDFQYCLVHQGEFYVGNAILELYSFKRDSAIMRNIRKMPILDSLLSFLKEGSVYIIKDILKDGPLVDDILQ